MPVRQVNRAEGHCVGAAAVATGTVIIRSGENSQSVKLPFNPSYLRLAAAAVYRLPTTIITTTERLCAVQNHKTSLAELVAYYRHTEPQPSDWENIKFSVAMSRQLAVQSLEIGTTRNEPTTLTMGGGWSCDDDDDYNEVDRSGGRGGKSGGKDSSYPRSQSSQKQIQSKCAYHVVKCSEASGDSFRGTSTQLDSIHHPLILALIKPPTLPPPPLPPRRRRRLSIRLHAKGSLSLWTSDSRVSLPGHGMNSPLIM